MTLSLNRIQTDCLPTFSESVPKYNAVPPPKQLNNSSITPTTSPETSIIEVSATSDQIKQLSDSIGSGKDKTPMCLVNELARFNKVHSANV